MFKILWFLVFLVTVSCSIFDSDDFNIYSLLFEPYKASLLVFRDGQEFTPKEIKGAVKTALETGVKLDPFCTAIMEAINEEYGIIEPFFNFIFDGYEHSVISFHSVKSESWDFLINQAFIQYLESGIDLKLVEDQIINRLVIPKYPILDLIKYEFNCQEFVERDVGFRGDLTGHFEELQAITFFTLLNKAVLSSDEEEYKKLLTTVKIGMTKEVIPYLDFLLNTPIEVMKTVWFPTKDILSDLKYSLIIFVSKTVYSELKKKSPEMIEEIFKNLADSEEMKYFKFLMKFNETKQDENRWFIITNPLEFYLKKAVETRNIEEIKVLKDVLNVMNEGMIEESMELAVMKDDVEIFELLLDETLLKNANYLGVHLFNYAVRKDKRKMLEHFLQRKTLRPNANMLGNVLVDLLQNGDTDNLVYIIKERYEAGLDSNNLTKLLLLAIENGEERIIKLILWRESMQDHLIFYDHLHKVFLEILKKKSTEVMKLFLKRKEIIKRIEISDDLNAEFSRAVKDKNLELINLFLECDSIDEDVIFNHHMEAIETNNDEMIDIFETYILYKNEE